LIDKKYHFFLIYISLYIIIFILFIGGYKVDIIFATNEICTEFEDKLAVDTKTRLTEDRENKNTSQNLLVDYGLFPGDLRQFPFIDLKAQAYTPLLTGLLSQHAFYTLNEHKTAINSMFV